MYGMQRSEVNNIQYDIFKQLVKPPLLPSYPDPRRKNQ